MAGKDVSEFRNDPFGVEWDVKPYSYLSYLISVQMMRARVKSLDLYSTSADRKTDRQTDGRTPDRCFSLTAMDAVSV